MTKLCRETVATVKEGDFLCSGNYTYFVRTSIESTGRNRKCYYFTLVFEDGRTLYAEKSSALYGLKIVKSAKYWNVDTEEAVETFDIYEAWKHEKKAGYGGSFPHFLYDECLGRNGSLITWEAHEAREAKLAEAEAEAQAEADFA